MSFFAPAVIVSTVSPFCQLILSKLIPLKFFYRFCAAAPAVNGKGIACAGCFIIASIQIGICDIGRTADNDFVVISTTTIIYIAAVNITWYRTAADDNGVVISFTVVRAAAVNSACYFSIAADVDSVAVSAVTVWSITINSINITAVNGETVTITAAKTLYCRFLRIKNLLPYLLLCYWRKITSVTPPCAYFSVPS